MDNKEEGMSTENDSPRQEDTGIFENENSRGNLEVSAVICNDNVKTDKVATDIIAVEQVLEMETDDTYIPQENNLNTNDHSFVEIPSSNIMPSMDENTSAMDDTFGIKNMFSSTLNESLLNQSSAHVSSIMSESYINSCNTSLDGKELLNCNLNEQMTECMSVEVAIAEVVSSVLAAVLETVSQDDNTPVQISPPHTDSQVHVKSQKQLNIPLGLDYVSDGDSNFSTNPTINRSMPEDKNTSVHNNSIDDSEKSVHLANSILNNCEISDSRGMRSLQESLDEGKDIPMVNASLNSSVLNSTLGIDNLYKTLHKSIPVANETPSNSTMGLNDSVQDNIVPESGSFQDSAKRMCEVKASMDSSVLNSSMGIGRLYKSMNESSMSGVSSLDSTMGLKKSVHEEGNGPQNSMVPKASLDNSVLNSSGGIDNIYKSMNESFSAAILPSLDTTMGFNNLHKSAHEESLNNSVLNSTTCIEKHSKSVNESVSAANVSSLDSTMGSDNLDKSHLIDTAQGNGSLCNSSGRDLNNSNTLNRSVLYSTTGIDALHTTLNESISPRNVSSLDSTMGLNNLSLPHLEDIAQGNGTLHNSSGRDLNNSNTLNSSVLNSTTGIDVLHTTLNESISPRNVSSLDPTMGLDNLDKSHLIDTAQGNGSLCNSSGRDLNNSNTLNRSVLNSTTGIDALHTTLNESISPRNVSSLDSTMGLNNLSLPHLEDIAQGNGTLNNSSCRDLNNCNTLNSSVLNSTTGIDVLHTTLNESISPRNVSSLDPTMGLDNLYKSHLEDIAQGNGTLGNSSGRELNNSNTLNSSVVNSTTGIEKHSKPVNESVSAANVSSLDSTMGLNNPSMPHLEDIAQGNRSLLNSSGRDLNNSNTLNSSVMDSTIGLVNLHKSHLEDNPQGNRSLLNSSGRDLNNSFTLNGSVLNSTMGIDKLHTTLNESSSPVIVSSLDSTNGLNNLSKSLHEGTQPENSSVCDSSFIANNGLAGSLNNSALDSTMGLSKLYRSMNESVSITNRSSLDSSRDLSNLRKSVNDDFGLGKSSTCAVSKNISNATLNSSALNSTMETDKLFTSLNEGTLANTSLTNLRESIDGGFRNISKDNTSMFQGNLSTTSVRETSNRSELKSPKALENIVVNVEGGATISVFDMSTDDVLDRSVDGSCTNLRNTDLFPAEAETNSQNQEEDGLIREDKLLECFKNRDYIDSVNTTKYFLKDVDQTVCMNGNKLDEVSVGLKNAEDGRGGGWEDMEVTMIRPEPTREEQAREILTKPSNPIDEKSFSLTLPLNYIDEDQMDITRQSFPEEKSFNFLKPSRVEDLNELERGDGNPEVTILGDETILLSQSVIHQDLKCERYVNKPIMNKNQGDQNSENYNATLNKSIHLSVSLDETGMCAMDYSLPLSDCTGLVSEQDESTKKDSRVSKSCDGSLVGRDVSLRLRNETSQLCSSPGKDTSLETNTSATALWWDSFRQERSFLGNNSFNISRMTAEERKLFSETINSSIYSKTLSPEEEVNSLKEHLLLVMDLLEKENSDFESFRQNCESEKLQLMSKINLLENQISNIKDSEVSKIDNEKQTLNETLKMKEQELCEVVSRYNSSEAHLKQSQRDLEGLKNLFLLTETEIPQLSDLVSQLNLSGISTEGLMVEGMGSVVHLKTVLNILSSLLLKHNHFVTDYNQLLEGCSQDKAELQSLRELTHNYSERERQLTVLQEKCTELQTALQGNQDLVAHLKQDMVSFNQIKESLHNHQLDSDTLKEHSSKTNEELLSTKEKYIEICSKFETLEKEYSVSTEKYESLKLENNNLLNEYEKCKEHLLNLQEVHNKHSDLENYCEGLNEKCVTLENNYSEKVAQCEDYFKINENLQNELHRLNSLFEEEKRISKNISLQVKEEYNLLKTKFEERSSMLDRKMTEIDSLKEVNDLIKNDIENINQAVGESNLLLTPEFKALLLQFEEINLKLNILDNDKIQLNKNYAEAGEHIKFLESDRANEIELKNKYVEEVSSLNVKLTEISQAYSDIQTKYNSIISENDSGNAVLSSLNVELQELKSKYDESLSNVTKLQETCFEKTESNKLLEEMVSVLNLNIKEQENNLSELKNQFNDVLSKYENESSKLKKIQIDHSLLEEKYIATERMMEGLQKLANEKETSHDESTLKVVSLLEEINLLKGNSSIMNTKFEELLSQHENECSNSATLKTEINNITQKYHDSIETVQKLENVCLENDGMIKKFKEEMSNIASEAQKVKEDLFNAREACDILGAELSAERLKVAVVTKEKADLETQLREVSDQRELSTTALADLTKDNEKYTSEIENLNIQIYEFNAKLINIQNLFESEMSKVKSLETELTDLEVKYKETTGALEMLEKQSTEKDNLYEKLEEEGRQLHSEVLALQIHSSKLSTEISEHESNLETKRCEYRTLEELNAELVAKHQQALNQIDEVQKDSYEKLQVSEKLHEELDQARNQLVLTNESLVSLQSEFNKITLLYAEEQIKLQTQIEEYDKLNNEFQAALSKIHQLETDCYSSSNNNQILTGELTQVKLELENISRKFSCLKDESDVLSVKNNEECIRHQELQSVYQELLIKYKESLNWVKELEREISGDLWEDHDGFEDVHQGYNQRYNSAISSLKQFKEIFSTNKKINEKQEIEIEGLKSGLSGNEIKFIELKASHESLLVKLEEANDRCILLQEELGVAEVKYAEMSSKAEQLECDLQTKLKETSSRCKLLEEELEVAEARYTEMSSKAALHESDLQNKLVEASARYKLLQEELVVVQAKYEEASSKVELLIDDLQAKLEESNAQCNLLEKELEDVQTKFAETSSKAEQLESNLQTKLEEESSRCKILQEQLEVVQAQCTEMSSKAELVVGDLQTKLEGSSAQCKLLQEQLEVVEARYADTSSKSALHESDLQNKLEEASARYKLLQEELAVVQTKYEEASSKAELLKDDLQAKLEESNAQCKLLEKELEVVETKYAETSSIAEQLESNLQTKLAEESSRCKLLQEQLEVVQAQYAEASTKAELFVSDLQTKLEESSALSKLLQEQLEVVEARYTDTSSKAALHESDLQNKLEEASDRYKLLQEELTVVQAKYEEASSIAEQLKCDLQAKLEESNAQCKLLEKKLEDVETRFAETSSKAEQLESNLQTKLEEESSRCMLLQEQLEVVQAQYVEASTRAELLVGDLQIKLEESSAQSKLLQEQLEVAEARYTEMSSKAALHESDLQNKLVEASARYKLLQEELEVVQAKYEEESSKTDLLKGDFHTKLEESSARCKLLEEELEAVETKYAEASSKAELLVADLQTKLNEASAQCKLLQEQLEVLETKYTETSSILESDLQSKFVENNQLQLLNSEMKNHIGEINKDISILQEDLKISKQENVNLIEDCNKFRVELESLSSVKALKEEIERNYCEVESKCEMVEVALLQARKELEEYKCLESKLLSETHSLRSENETLLNQTSLLSLQVQQLTSDLENTQAKTSQLEQDLEVKHSELRKAGLQIENFNHYQELVGSLLSDFPFLGEEFSEGVLSSSDSSVFEVFLHCIEKALKEFSQVRVEYSEKKACLVETQEEIMKLNENLKSLMEKLQETELQATNSNEAFISLKDKHDSLLDAYNEIQGKLESLSQQSNILNTENNQLKLTNDNLTGELEDKNTRVKNLLEVQHKFEALSNDNNTILFELSNKCQENDNIKAELTITSQQSADLKVELENNLKELYSLKENKSGLEIENKKLKSDNLKYQKEYQNSIDNLRKTREEMCSLEKNCDEKMSRFTFILKEKEEFENRTLQLLKQNDELSVKIRDLTAKVFDHEKSYSQYLELQSAHSILNEEKNQLQTQVVEYQKIKKENIDLKAYIATKDSKINEIINDYKQVKDNYQQKTAENQNLVDKVCSLMPGVGNFVDTMKVLEDKMNLLKSIEEELKEERIKCENLDEECNILNGELTYKEKIVGEMYVEHSEKVKALTESLNNHERTNQESLAENQTLKEKVNTLEEDILQLKTAQPSPCTNCMNLKESLQKSKISLVDRNAKITSLEQHLEGFQTSYKKKVHEYRKKILHLQDELSKGRALPNKEEQRVPLAEASSQTDSAPEQLSAQGGIIHLTKIREQEEKIQKMEKENHVLKKVCHNRHQMIKDLQAKLDSKPCDEPKRARTVLSEVQRN